MILETFQSVAFLKMRSLSSIDLQLKDTSPVKSLKQKIISQNNLDMLVGIIAKNKTPKPKPKTTLANLCRNVC